MEDCVVKVVYGAYETLDRLGDDEFDFCPHLLSPGVYALLHNRIVVYIGQSMKPLTRIYTHRNMWGKKRRTMIGNNPTVRGILFDDVWIRPCLVEELDEVEIAMIKKYKPLYNIHHNKLTTVPPEMQNLVERIVASKGKIYTTKSDNSPRIERRGF